MIETISIIRDNNELVDSNDLYMKQANDIQDDIYPFNNEDEEIIRRFINFKMDRNNMMMRRNRQLRSQFTSRFLI